VKFDFMSPMTEVIDETQNLQCTEPQTPTAVK